MLNETVFILPIEIYFRSMSWWSTTTQLQVNRLLLSSSWNDQEIYSLRRSTGVKFTAIYNAVISSTIPKFREIQPRSFDVTRSCQTTPPCDRSPSQYSPRNVIKVFAAHLARVIVVSKEFRCSALSPPLPAGQTSLPHLFRDVCAGRPTPTCRFWTKSQAGRKPTSIPWVFGKRATHTQTAICVNSCLVSCLQDEVIPSSRDPHQVTPSF